MLTVFKHSLGRSKGAILGWGISLAFFAFLMVLFFDTIAADAESFEALLQVYPPELMAFFGEISSFTTPDGFLSIEFFSFMPLILGVFAILSGSGMLADDEESGVLDLIAAQPVSRSGLFWGRLLSFVVSMIGILTMVWAAIMISSNFYVAEFDGARLAGGMVSLGTLMLFLFGLALIFSMLLPSRKSASMLSGILLIAAFFITGLADINNTLSNIAVFSPLKYYQGTTWNEGFNWEWFSILAGSTALFMLASWWRFERRDIRVGGEGELKIKLSKLLQFGRGKA